LADSRVKEIIMKREEKRKIFPVGHPVQGKPAEKKRK